MHRLSLIDQVRHAYRPRTRVLVKDTEARWFAVPAAPDQLAAPGVVVSNLLPENGIYAVGRASNQDKTAFSAGVLNNCNHKVKACQCRK